MPGGSVPLYEAKAELFRALGHPVRIRVLELLSEREHAVHELLAVLDVEASSLSQQLARVAPSWLGAPAAGRWSGRLFAARRGDG